MANITLDLLLNEISIYLRPTYLHRLALTSKPLTILISKYQEQVDFYDTFPLMTSFAHAILNQKYYWIQYVADLFENPNGYEFTLENFKSNVLRTIMNKKLFSILMSIDFDIFRMALLKETAKVSDPYYFMILTNCQYNKLKDEELDLALSSAIKHNGPHQKSLYEEYKLRDPNKFYLTERALAIHSLPTNVRDRYSFAYFNYYINSLQDEQSDILDRSGQYINELNARDLNVYYKRLCMKIITSYNYDMIITLKPNFYQKVMDASDNYYDRDVLNFYSADFPLIYRDYKRNKEYSRWDKEDSSQEQYISIFWTLFLTGSLQEFRDYLNKNPSYLKEEFSCPYINGKYLYNPYNDLLKQREEIFEKMMLVGSRSWSLEERISSNVDCLCSGMNKFCLENDYEILMRIMKELSKHQSRTSKAVFMSIKHLFGYT